MDKGRKNHETANTDQRRYVSILFCDISHSTQLGEARDPEDSAYVVRTVKSIAKEVITRFGGSVNQFHGDGVLAIFGYPSPQEDDVQRATEAALELHGAVEELDLSDYLPDGFELHMHSGIESGLVLIRQGDFLDGPLELVGDAVNTAAGLCSAAGENEIIASAATLRSVSPFFETIELEPLKLKGKSNLVPAFKVIQRSKVQSRFEASQVRGLTAFCGRRDELSILRQCLRHAQAGEQQVVQIVGDPGMGKTRLMDEFAREAKVSGSLVHRGRCEPSGSVAPMHPFLQILRAFFEMEGPLTDDEARLHIEQRLAELDEDLLAHSEAFLRALAVLPARAEIAATTKSGKNSSSSNPGMEIPLEKWFLAQSKKEPVVIILDDWQWVDDASRNIFSYLVRQLSSSKILILLAVRDLGLADVASGRSERILLKPIGKRETEQIVDALMPGQQELGIAAKLHVKSGGNPLFLEELCQSYPEWSQQEEETVVGSVVPATLQGLIETRVQRLPKEQIELAQTASVIGNIIPAWLLKRLSGIDGPNEIFQKLADSDLIYTGEIQGTLQFKHGITRETIYATVGLRKRRQLHKQIAEIFEELQEFGSLEEHYESLAYHHAAAASYEKALYYAQLAGDKALASSSLDRARQQYEAALNAIDKLPATLELKQLWISISSNWALPCVYGPEPAQLDILQRTVDYALELEDVEGLALTHYWQGYISHVLGDQTASINFYNQALTIARQTNNNRLAVQVTATLGQSHAAASNYSEALKYLDQAIDEKREHPTKFRIRVGSSYALSSKALVLGDMGRFEDAHMCSKAAYISVSGQGHEIESSILNNHGTVSLWQGRWVDAIDLSRRSRVIAEQVSAPYLFACAEAINAYGQWMLQRDTNAISALRQIVSWVEDKGMYLYSSFFYGWISDALVSNGNFDDACQFALQGLERASKQDRVGEAMSYRTLATAAAKSDRTDLEAPDFYLDAAMRSANERQSAHEIAVTQMHLAQFLTEKQDLDKAARLQFEAEKAFEKMGMSWHLQQITGNAHR